MSTVDWMQRKIIFSTEANITQTITERVSVVMKHGDPPIHTKIISEQFIIL